MIIMKRIVLSSIAIVVCLCSASGQDGHSFRKLEMSFGIGGAPALSSSDVGHGLWSMAVEIRYSPVKWLSVGVMGGMHDWSDVSYLMDAKDSPDGNAKPVVKTGAMLLVYGNWFTRESLKVYSGIGVGTKNKEIGNGIPVGLEFVPAGIAFGKRFYGFCECCFGTMAAPTRLGFGYRF